MPKLTDALSQTLLYGFSIAIMKGVSLLMLPLIAHYLSPDEFGRLEVINTLAIVGSILVGMGLEDTLYRFAGGERDPRRRRQLAAQIFTLTLVVGLLAIGLGHVAAPSLAALIPGGADTWQVRLVLYLLALEGCIAVPLGWLRMQNRALGFFALTTSRALAQAVLVVIALDLGRGVSGILEAALIAALGQALLLVLLQVRDTGLALRREVAGAVFIYSLPIVGSGCLAFVLNGLDRWILAAETTLADVAHYGIAAKFALATVLLMQPFGMWWSPRRFEVLNAEQGKSRVTRVITFGLALTLVIAVAVSLAAPLMIAWLLPESYLQAGRYAIGLILIMMLREMTELINLGCYTGATTRAQLIINAIGAVVGLAGMLWLTPQFAVWGLIGALTLAQLARLLLFFAASQHYLPLPYPARLLPLLLIGGGGLALASASASAPLQLGIVGATLLILLALAATLIDFLRPAEGAG